MNLTVGTIADVLRGLAHDAGHDAASVKMNPDHCTGEIEFMITDSRGTIFSGSIPSEWRDSSKEWLAPKLRAKYPQAFKPLAEIAEKTPGSTRPLFTADAGTGEGALDIRVDGSDLLRVYQGASIDQTFDTGDGNTVRIIVHWSRK